MNPNGPPEPEQEAEQPIRVLRDLEQETSPDFAGKVRRKILRRTSTAQFAGFSWNLPKVILLELVNLLRHLFTAVSGRRQS